MIKFQDFLILIIMGFLLVFAISMNNDNNGSSSKSDSNSGSNSNSDSDSGQKDEDSPTIYWGVDSASYTDADLRQCVKDNFGQADIWGRYLGDIADVSQGLDTDEVKALHDDNTRILVIYNHFSEATGYDNGVNEAEKAINYADDLSIPEDVAIFGDIEPSYPVDSAFLEGWYNTLSASPYETGLYGVFNEDSNLVKAYNATKEPVQENTVVWTAYPQKETTTKENAPDYNPQGPNDALLYGWQYGIESEQCNIDTNLFKEEMLDYLW